MKNLNQALDEAYKKAGRNAYFANGFIAGVEYATKFISVNQDFPNIGTPVLLKFYNDTYKVGYYLNHSERGLGFYEYPEPDIEFILHGVTEWKPIEYN